MIRLPTGHTCANESRQPNSPIVWIEPEFLGNSRPSRTGHQIAEALHNRPDVSSFLRVEFSEIFNEGLSFGVILFHLCVHVGLLLEYILERVDSKPQIADIGESPGIHGQLVEILGTFLNQPQLRDDSEVVEEPVETKGDSRQDFCLTHAKRGKFGLGFWRSLRGVPPASSAHLAI